MGIKIELSANSREPLAKGIWQVELVKFDSGKSAVKKTPFVQPVFKVLEEDAVRTDGEPFTGRLWGDQYWLTANSMFRLKQFAEELGSELPGEGAEFEDEAEYAEALTDALAGSTGFVTTDLESFVDKDDNDRQKAIIEKYDF